ANDVSRGGAQNKASYGKGRDRYGEPQWSWGEGSRDERHDQKDAECDHSSSDGATKANREAIKNCQVLVRWLAHATFEITGRCAASSRSVRWIDGLDLTASYLPSCPLRLRQSPHAELP